MDKINISAIGTLTEAQTSYLQIGDTTIEVKKALPYQEVLSAIQWVISFVVDDRTFISAPLAAIIEDIAIMKFYTNLDLGMFDAEKFEVQEAYEVYNIIAGVDGYDKVRAQIDVKQLNFFHDNLWKTMESIVAYRNSAAGILETISFQAKTTSNDIEEVIEGSKTALTSESVQKLMEVVNKLGEPTTP